MSKQVLDIYNDVCDHTGFPRYTNETDTPETTRFILNMITLGLHNVIDGVYLSNNILERTDTIHTTKGKQEYGIDGIIKNIQIKNDKGQYVQVPYDNHVNEFMITDNEESKQDIPSRYVINKGYIKFYPCPDKDYEVKVTLSTSDLVLANNDSGRRSVQSVDDTIMADEDFCQLVFLRTAAIIFAKCNNTNAALYNQLVQERMKTYLEHDLGSLQTKRNFISDSGNYSSRRGLID